MYPTDDGGDDDVVNISICVTQFNKNTLVVVAAGRYKNPIAINFSSLFIDFQFSFIKSPTMKLFRF